MNHEKTTSFNFTSLRVAIKGTPSLLGWLVKLKVVAFVHLWIMPLHVHVALRDLKVACGGVWSRLTLTSPRFKKFVFADDQPKNEKPPDEKMTSNLRY